MMPPDAVDGVETWMLRVCSPAQFREYDRMIGNYQHLIVLGNQNVGRSQAGRTIEGPMAMDSQVYNSIVKMEM